MTIPDSNTIAVGSILIEAMLHWPWPPPRSFMLVERQMDDGAIHLLGEPSGCLRFQVSNSDGLVVLDATTCPLEMPERVMSAIAISWEVPNHWTACMNGTFIGSKDGSQVIPDIYRVRRRISASKPVEDFGRRNADALLRRRAKLMGTHTRPGRRQADDGHILSALADEVLQLEDLIVHLRDGKVHHAKGVSSRLRMLIATGDPLPLLQLAAAMINAPLIVYTEPRPPTAGIDGASMSLGISLWSKPTDDSINPIDLDVWLEQMWGQLGNKHRTHRRVITDLGDTIGSHFDRGIHPAVDALRSANSEVGGIRQDFLLAYLLQVSAVVLELARSVLLLASEEP